MGPVASSLSRCGKGRFNTCRRSFVIFLRSCWALIGGVVAPCMVSPPSYLLLSVVSPRVGARRHDAIRRELVSTICAAWFARTTTDCTTYVFTRSTVPATGLRRARQTLQTLLSNSFFLCDRSL